MSAPAPSLFTPSAKDMAEKLGLDHVPVPPDVAGAMNEREGRHPSNVPAPWRHGNVSPLPHFFIFGRPMALLLDN